MKNTENIQIEEVQVLEENAVPGVVKIILAPDKTTFSRCSDYTKNNFKKLTWVLVFSSSLCGLVLGASISKYALGGSTISLFFTVPIAILMYVLLDRTIIMADTRKNVKFLKTSRYVMAIVLGLFNSLLLDSFFYEADIKTEISKDILIEQNNVAVETTALINIREAHKQQILNQIAAGEKALTQRNSELVSEVEGRSFSGHIGKGIIATEKEKALNRETARFEETKVRLLADAAKDDSAIVQIQREGVQKKASAHERVSTGFNNQMALLHRSIMRSAFNIFMAILFFLFAMIFELLPLLAKNQTDLSEYFEIADQDMNAHLQSAEMNTDNLISQQQYMLHLSNQRALHKEQALHQRQLFEQKSTHNELMLEAVTHHFQKIAEKETELKKTYPEQYQQHLSHTFNKMYEMSKTNQDEATLSITSTDESQKKLK